ncbi:MAG: hypothetical protein O7G88_10235 [bacterium]|nr:hypothetical protein [bacterium]
MTIHEFHQGNKCGDVTTAGRAEAGVLAAQDVTAFAPEDLDLFQYVESAEQAWDAIRAFYGV